MNKTDLLNYLKETSYAMTQSDMDEAILLHFELVMQSYRKKPFFYKTLLKYDRYMVALSLLNFSYEDSRVPLSKVKAFCQARGYLSRNSLDAYFSFFSSPGICMFTCTTKMEGSVFSDRHKRHCVKPRVCSRRICCRRKRSCLIWAAR